MKLEAEVAVNTAARGRSCLVYVESITLQLLLSRHKPCAQSILWSKQTRWTDSENEVNRLLFCGSTSDPSLTEYTTANSS